jgi:hypothetical protein
LTSPPLTVPGCGRPLQNPHEPLHECRPPSVDGKQDRAFPATIPDNIMK